MIQARKNTKKKKKKENIEFVLLLDSEWAATRRSWGGRCGRRVTRRAAEKCWVTWRRKGRCREEFHASTSVRWGGETGGRVRVALTWANRVTLLTPPPDDGTSSNSSAGRRPRVYRGPGTRPPWTPTTTITNDRPSRTRGMVNERYNRLVTFIVRLCFRAFFILLYLDVYPFVSFLYLIHVYDRLVETCIHTLWV